MEESVCLELESDMMTVRGGEHPVAPGPVLARGTDFDGHGFFEASSIRKVNGKYYFVYSSVLSHELCYAVSDFPNKDFRFGGTLVSIADIGYQGNTVPNNYTGNTHGGMAEINGQWYIFYHRQTNKTKCSRQACAEKLTILPDGTIPQVETTSCGLNEGPLSGKGRYEARIACSLSAKNGTLKSDSARKRDRKNEYPFFTQSGEDRESNPDQYIANMQDGSWCGFKYFAFDGTETSITVTVCGSAMGNLKVYTDRFAEPVAVLRVTASQKYKTFTGKLSPIIGTQALYFVYNGTGALDFKEFETETIPKFV